MKKHSYIYISLLAAGVAFTSCEPEFDNDVTTEQAAQVSGDADFSSFVSLGNSLTAGFADAALYRSGQEAAFPNLLANQMKAAGGGEFTTPFMADNVGGFADIPGEAPNTLRFGPRLVFDATNRAPVPLAATPTTNAFDLNTTGVAFNNLGVPGARVFHLTADGYGNAAGVAAGLANPYYARFSTSPGTNIVADALSKQPTFFSLWIGSNDVLSYATAGGTGEVQTDLTAPPAGDDITATLFFTDFYNDIVQALTSGGAKGILTNIPNPRSVPFFTTVPYNAIPLDAATAELANNGYAEYNGALLQANQFGLISDEELAARQISFNAGQNAMVILDKDLTDLASLNPAFARAPQLRQTTPFDLVVLTASSVIGQPPAEGSTLINGVSAPLADQWVLTSREQARATTATRAFNAVIAQIAEQAGLALYDVNERLKTLSREGVSINGAVYNNQFVTGGVFSLDGIHLSPRGNAIIANEMIELINETYGSTLQPVNVDSFDTVTFQ